MYVTGEDIKVILQAKIPLHQVAIQSNQYFVVVLKISLSICFDQ